MSKFEDKFLKGLEEDIGLEQASPDEAFAQEGDLDLDDNVADQFSTDPNMPGMKDKYAPKIDSWGRKVDQFNEWLSGSKGNSLRVELERIEDSYEGSTKDASASIKKISLELASLGKTLSWVLDSVVKADKETEAKIYGGE